jgi:hypothetical protein
MFGHQYTYSDDGRKKHHDLFAVVVHWWSKGNGGNRYGLVHVFTGAVPLTSDDHACQHQGLHPYGHEPHLPFAFSNFSLPPKMSTYLIEGDKALLPITALSTMSIGVLKKTKEESSPCLEKYAAKDLILWKVRYF